jgi:DNA repair protein RecN (Recombination protein N)
MLVELTIRDFAIVDHIRLSWDGCLNVLTGETGAGKSIIVDAVGALLGDRLGPEVVRSGQERAFVEGIFAIRADSPGGAALHDLLAAHELLEEDGQVILSRELARGGRSVARLNGRAVPVSLLQQVGEHLIDVHGQSQHLSLLRVREHLDFLDRFAGLVELRRSVGQLVGRWRAVQAERRKLQDEVRAAARERDLLRHEVAEIEAADLRPEEEDELSNARERLRHAERLRQAAEQSLLALQGFDEQRGAAELLGQAAGLCLDASRADTSLRSLAEMLERLATEAEEAARDLRGYLDRLETDPRQAEKIEARFLAVAELKRKYGDTVETVLEYLERARDRMATAERGEEGLGELAERERRVREELAGATLELSARRSQAIASLVRAVEKELSDLNMAGARFCVAIEQHADPEGITWPAVEGEMRTIAVDGTGADRAEFLFSANPGEPPRALARVASGGELARVSLALKAALARVDQRATLIFDEIDVGVGGRGAAVVGQKLWDLTRTHQVLCVTHLPQVAAFADQHLVVAKKVEDDSTRTVVERVSGSERIAELAAMLGGGPGSRAVESTARELLARSDGWKAASSSRAQGSAETREPAPQSRRTA